MTDIVSASLRSRMMAGIKGRDTAPEWIVRRYLHAAGLRFRIHMRTLPGTPDLVFPRHRAVILVHGCFWHRHIGCRFATFPGTRTEFWRTKFDRNAERDRHNEAALRSAGWTVITAWECEVRSEEFLDQLFWRVVASGLS